MLRRKIPVRAGRVVPWAIAFVLPRDGGSGARRTRRSTWRARCARSAGRSGRQPSRTCCRCCRTRAPKCGARPRTRSGRRCSRCRAPATRRRRRSWRRPRRRCSPAAARARRASRAGSWPRRSAGCRTALPRRCARSSRRCAVRLQDAHPAVVAGAAKGLDALIRNTVKVQPPEAATIAQLRAAATLGSDPVGRRLRAGAPPGVARLAAAGRSTSRPSSAGSTIPICRSGAVRRWRLRRPRPTDAQRRALLAARSPIRRSRSGTRRSASTARTLQAAGLRAASSPRSTTRTPTSRWRRSMRSATAARRARIRRRG